MDGAIIPTIELTNRALKRQFVNEAKKIALALEIINQKFIWELYNAPDYMTYKDIYQIYSAKWSDKVRELTRSKEFVIAGIDVLFFSREYAPQI